MRRLALAVLLRAAGRPRGLACAAASAAAAAAAAAALSHGRRSSSSASSSSATSFVCTSCGHDARKWSGRCASCGEYDTLREFRPSSASSSSSPRNVSAGAARAAAQRAWLAPPPPSSPAAAAAARLQPIGEAEAPASARLPMHSAELDRVLGGGGLVRGSVTLLAGAPGVGKSTLLLQLAALLCRAEAGGEAYCAGFAGADRAAATRAAAAAAAAAAGNAQPAPSVAYVSGEEAASQLAGRARRLGIAAPGLLVLNESRVESVLEQLDAVAGAAQRSAGAPLAAVVIDSVQTLFTDACPGAAGSVSQVRESTLRLLNWAKATGVPLLLAGHVTKGGDIAGPRTLEHIVDTVLVLEAEDAAGGAGGLLGGGGGGGSDGGGIGGGGGGGFFHSHRLLRCVKNRFGPAGEVGLFEMTARGFVESSALRLFLSGGAAEARPAGCAVGVVTEGSRSLCVEMQSLTGPPSGPYARLRAAGVASERLHVVHAVLARHAGSALRLGAVDVLASTVGGLRVSDVAADLALAVAIASAASGVPAPAGAVFVGELGLGGEVRPAPRLEERLRAAAQLGFATAFVPASGGAPAVHGLRVVALRNVREAVAAALPSAAR